VKSAITLVILGLVGAAAVSAQQAQAGVRPVASVLQLHAVMINPSSDAVFGAAGDPPATDAAWLQASGQALVLAESGNLLMLGRRARDNAAWMRLSRAMVDAAAAAAAAAEQRTRMPWLPPATPLRHRARRAIGPTATVAGGWASLSRC